MAEYYTTEQLEQLRTLCVYGALYLTGRVPDMDYTLGEVKRYWADVIKAAVGGVGEIEIQVQSVEEEIARWKTELEVELEAIRAGIPKVANEKMDIMGGTEGPQILMDPGKGGGPSAEEETTDSMGGGMEIVEPWGLLEPLAGGTMAGEITARPGGDDTYLFTVAERDLIRADEAARGEVIEWHDKRRGVTETMYRTLSAYARWAGSTMTFEDYWTRLRYDYNAGYFAHRWAHAEGLGWEDPLERLHYRHQ
jgi:hypothetical protein